MPKRVPVQTIILHREGKQFSPEIGKAFDFTADELADIVSVNPEAVRKPVIEDNGDAEKTDAKVPADKTDAKAPAAKTAAKGNGDL